MSGGLRSGHVALVHLLVDWEAVGCNASAAVSSSGQWSWDAPPRPAQVSVLSVSVHVVERKCACC